MSSMSFQGFAPASIAATRAHLEAAAVCLRRPEGPDYAAAIAAINLAWGTARLDRGPDNYDGVDDGAWDEVTTGTEAMQAQLRMDQGEAFDSLEGDLQESWETVTEIAKEEGENFETVLASYYVGQCLDTCQ